MQTDVFAGELFGTCAPLIFYATRLLKRPKIVFKLSRR